MSHASEQLKKSREEFEGGISIQKNGRDPYWPNWDGVQSHISTSTAKLLDRKRCVVLIKAIPEWIPRLSEIEALNIEGKSNGKKVMPWNEQIPLIRAELTS